MDIPGRYYVKGPKLRQEMMVDGIEMVSLFYYSTQTICKWAPRQKTALRLDTSEATLEPGQTPRRSTPTTGS